MQRSVDAGARVVIDTMGEPLEAVIDIPVWMFRINRKAAEDVSGTPVHTRDEAAAVAAQLATMATVASVSAAAEGASLSSNGQTWTGHVGIHPGRVLNTVGCGNALLAGLIHGWIRTGDWVKALREGLAAATANATTVMAGDLDPDTLDEFREIATVESADIVASGQS